MKADLSQRCTIYPLAALRATVLQTQLLTRRNDASPAFTLGTVVDLVKTLGYVQIDTLHVVNRAHYVTLWASFGSYDIDDFHRLVYTADQRALYEGWGHAASIISLDHYRYHRWRTDRRVSFNPGYHEWLNKDGNRDLVAQTLERIRSEGGLGIGDFEDDGPKRSSWYDWKPSKMALEVLFAYGDLMVADRVNFQRVYDAKERVLPEWVDTTPIDSDEARRYCLEQAAKALGVFEPHHLTLYAYMRATPARSIIRALIEEGVLVEIRLAQNHLLSRSSHGPPRSSQRDRCAEGVGAVRRQSHRSPRGKAGDCFVEALWRQFRKSQWRSSGFVQ